MKSLFLFRHAKSSWDTPGVPDDQRPLLPAGIRKTGLIVDFLKHRGTKADLIISSQAVRAYETARIVAAGLDYPLKNILKDRRIYDGPADRILELIFETKNESGSLMIFGHNPLITQLANFFMRPPVDDMPTSAVACIKFSTDKWEEIMTSVAAKEFFIFPKMLKA
jgi:phosphohistidine phosphatase